MAPEVVNDDDYSTAADVYSFGVTVHEILICKKPFERSTTNRNVKISDQIPKSYQNLISKCLVTDPRYRPTFSDIVKYLRNNKKFITDSVNEEEFLQFCEFVDSAHQIKKEFEQKVEINVNPIDLSLFKREELIRKEPFADVYRVVELKTGDNFAAKVSIADHDQDNQSLSREINLLLKLSSNSILKFIGYNKSDFSKKPRMTIITEFAKNGSLDQLLDNERKKVPNPKWNDTKRLINIFGIAFGMSYLHSKNILHRDLKPENIYLNELFFPKIGGFKFSKEIEYVSEEGNVDGTLAYMSPELIMKAINHKASDVYSFALVVYEMMALEVPYKGLDKNDILLKVTSGYRPKIAENVPDCYRELIQKCWSQDPSERPTFDSIVDLLKSNPDFITSTVDRSEFIRYINYLNNGSSEIEGMNEKEIHSELLIVEEEEEDIEIETNETVHKSINKDNSDQDTEIFEIDLPLSETNQQNQEEQKVIPENEEEQKEISLNEEKESNNKEDQKHEESKQEVMAENEEEQKEISLREEKESENEEDQKNEELKQKIILENEEEQKELFLSEVKEYENKEDQAENLENEEESKQNKKDEVIVKHESSEEADESEQRSDSEESSNSGVDKRNAAERNELGQAQKSDKSKKLSHKKVKRIKYTFPYSPNNQGGCIPSNGEYGDSIKTIITTD